MVGFRVVLVLSVAIWLSAYASTASGQVGKRTQNGSNTQPLNRQDDNHLAAPSGRLGNIHQKRIPNERVTNSLFACAKKRL